MDEALAPTNRNPIWSSGLTDHEVYMVGIRPRALEGATFELVIRRDGSDGRTQIPTFRVPGLDADVWFIALTDPEVEYAAWPFAFIEVTAQDGTLTPWSLPGVQIGISPSPTDDPVVSDEG